MKYLAVYAIFFAAFMLGGCKKIEDYNINNNEPTEIAPPYLLSGAQRQLIDDIWDEWMNGRGGMLLSQYWAQNQYTDESRYRFRTGTINSYWAQWYTGYTYDPSLTNPGGGGIQALQRIIKLNTDDATKSKYVQYGSNANQIAVARIMKAWMFHIITDVYGDIPYTDALGDKIYPKYDTQESIYRDLLKELKEAAAQINTGDAAVQGDIIYQGDMGKWVKFANALRIRVATRMADRDWATAKTHIEEASQNTFTSNADNALFKFAASPPHNNPLNEDRKTRADFATCATMLDTMASLGDPRLAIYAAPSKNGGLFVGKTYGLTQDSATSQNANTISQPGSAVLAATAPATYMDYAEVCFALAEAAERGAAITGDAATWYTNGIQASMDHWGVSATASAAYLAKPEVAYATANGDWKHKIGYQKWLGLFMQGFQGWAEWRRLDFGVLVFPTGITFIPKRLAYPTNEQTLNKKSYTEAVSRLSGGDKMTSKVWWDMN